MFNKKLKAQIADLELKLAFQASQHVDQQIELSNQHHSDVKTLKEKAAVEATTLQSQIAAERALCEADKQAA